MRDATAAGAALRSGRGRLCRGGDRQALVTDYYPANRTNRIFATIMPLVGLSPALGSAAGQLDPAHFDWQAILPRCLPSRWC